MRKGERERRDKEGREGEKGQGRERGREGMRKGERDTKLLKPDE